MSKSIKTSLILTLLLGSFELSANSNIKKEYYNNGIRDTLNLITKTVQFSQKKQELQGYIVYIDITDKTQEDIILVSSIARRLGFNISFLKLPVKNKTIEAIVFDEESRSVDTREPLSVLRKRGINASVVHYKNSIVVPTSLAFSHKIIYSIQKSLDRSYEKKISYLKKKIRHQREVIDSLQNNTTSFLKPQQKLTCEDSEQIIMGKIQVINRVVTDKYVKKTRQNYSNISPAKNISYIEKTDKTVKQKLQKNLKNAEQKEKKGIPKYVEKYNFSQLFKYIRSHCGIVLEKEALVCNAKIYNKGDSLTNKYILKYIRDDGLIVLQNSETFEDNPINNLELK